jgi:hypothetical protein
MVQDLLLLRIGRAGDDLRDLAFELGEVLVAGGRRSDDDQDAAQTVSGLPAGSSSSAARVSGQACGEFGPHGLRARLRVGATVAIRSDDS